MILSDGGEKNSISHAFACRSTQRIIKRAGTTRATSSIVKSGQKAVLMHVYDLHQTILYLSLIFSSYLL